MTKHGMSDTVFGGVSDRCFVESYFSDLESGGIKLGLERIGRLFSGLLGGEVGGRYIHVAGTNGKGTVAAFLASALSFCGYRTGLFTSPHLVSVRERFRLDGRAISWGELAGLVSDVRKFLLAEGMGSELGTPTYFEISAVLAARWFENRRAEFVVWETGMGGRCDATNVIVPEVSVITSIGLDHERSLGSSIVGIAAEKAGIIKRGVPVFLGFDVPSEAREVVAAKALEVGAELFEMEWSALDRFSWMTPGFRRRGAALAYAVLEHLVERVGIDIGDGMAGFDAVRWPGRYEKLSDGTIVDGAHNPSAAASLSEALEEEFPGRRFTVVFACSEDKDAFGVMGELAPLAAEFIFPECVRASASREFKSASELVGIAEGLGISSRLVSDVESALAASSGSSALVVGSLYLAGEVLEIVSSRESACEVLDIY